MFYVPGLLDKFEVKESQQPTHAALEHWKQMPGNSNNNNNTTSKYVLHSKDRQKCSIMKLISVLSCSTYTRRFVWDVYPTGFFARLLVKLMHLQLVVPVSWSNAAVLCSSFGDEVGFLLMKQRHDKHCLEVRRIQIDDHFHSSHFSATIRRKSIISLN